MRLVVTAAFLISLVFLVLAGAHVIYVSENHTTSLPETRDVSQNLSYFDVLLSRVESYLSSIEERLTVLSRLVSSSIERIRSGVSLLVTSIRGLVSEVREILDQIIKGSDFRFTVNIALSTRRGEVRHSFELHSNRGVIGNVLSTLRSTMSSVLERLSRIIRDFTSVLIGVVLYTGSIAILVNRVVRPE